MSTNVKTYKLRCTLLGHSLDVRGVGSGTTEGGKEFIVSGSRDRTTKVWIPSELGNFEVFQTCEGHTNFVSCVCIIPPSPKYPNGLILTGSHDHTILGFELGKPHPTFRLLGHKGTVCSIASTSDNIFVTGSWDMSAKIWIDQSNIGNLIGHEAAVWAVAALPSFGSRKVLTGSADKTIRLWDETDTSIMIFKGHTDCVRALQVIDCNKFLSASNDSSIRLWSVSEGETLNVLYGHTNFIYSLALINNEDFVSAGEDRTVRIWKGHECRQVIHLPATSVWTVAVMSNGDIAAGSSDGTVRVFSCEPDRQASAEELAKFEEEVGATTIAAQQDLGGMKVSQLPGPEALLKEGKKDGDTIMIREGSQVGCFSWSASERKWTKIGDVVGASGATQNTSGKVLHEGKEYDYVFSVDLDGKATCKLPYNIHEDPWFAAKRFIDKNNLDPQFLDQVANFIIKNTKGMEITQSSDSNYADPFTGGSRYVPGTSSSVAGPSGGGLDPFTGSGAYRTQSSVQSEATNNPSSFPAEPCFPSLTFLQFAQAPNGEGLKTKLKAFVAELGAESIATNEAIDNLVSHISSGKYTDEVDRLVKYFLTWPKEKVFPILDLLRVGSLAGEFVEALNSQIPVIEQLLSQFVAGPENGTNQMLVFRLLSNMFSSPKMLPLLMTHRSLIVSTVLNNLSKSKPNQIAASTLLLNYSVVVTSSSSNPHPEWVNVETQTEILMAALSLVELLEDPEAVYRLLVALGNLISYGKSASTTAVELFKSLNGDHIAKGFKQNGTLPKIQQCASQILTLIQ